MVPGLEVIDKMYSSVIPPVNLALMVARRRPFTDVVLSFATRLIVVVFLTTNNQESYSIAKL